MGTLAREAFEELVDSALEELPAELASRISNVDIVVQDLPGPEAHAAHVEPGSILLGLYSGIPLTQRGWDYGGVLPDRITIYQDNIERIAGSPERIPALVRRTVIHEVAHHFGISDERLHELGW
ncbi:MAG: metallopeptidase family protein [Actinomycetota bacterium]